ncbi:hypothetical protein FRC12_012293 [Ceratobasidium sp. 428]|nr:hypothetical protein FRC12_012293 [Ceratobasidium sp. 428]
MDYRKYGNVDKVSKFCGKKVQITNLNNGKTVVATVADACPSCENPECLDLSHGAYDALGEPRKTGMFPISYKFVN